MKWLIESSLVGLIVSYTASAGSSTALLPGTYTPLQLAPAPNSLPLSTEGSKQDAFTWLHTFPISSGIQGSGIRLDPPDLVLQQQFQVQQ